MKLKILDPLIQLLAPQFNSSRSKSANGFTLAARGFTLVELIIVVLILGIVAAISVPKINHSVVGYRADLAATRLAADLNLAASRARATSRAVTIDFTLTLPGQLAGYQFTDFHDPQRPGQLYQVQLESPPFQVELNQSPVSITFDVFSNPDQDATWVINEATEFQRIVTISQASGRVVVQ